MKNLFILPLMVLFISFLQAQQIPIRDFSYPVPQVQGSNIPASSLHSPIQTNSVNSIDPILAEMLSTRLEELFQSEDVVGVSAALEYGNDNIWADAIGLDGEMDSLNIENLFPVGGVSKPIIAACIMQMFEEGLLGLDDQIFNYIQAYPNIFPNITIRQLLNHTSGVFNFTEHPGYNDSLQANFSRIWTPEEVIFTFVETPLFTPGQNWYYSNTNYIVLGLIIESISQRPFYEEIRSRIFEPLNLESPLLFPQEELNGDLANLWADITGDNIPTDVSELVSMNAILSSFGASGAYISTPGDMSRWMNALMSGEYVQSNTVNRMQGIFPLNDQGTIGYGLGLLKAPSTCSDETWGHPGDVYYSSEVYYAPEYDLSIAVMLNDARYNSQLAAQIAQELVCTYVDYFITVSAEATRNDQFYFSIAPNPVEGRINLSYNLPRAASRVVVDLFNSLGNKAWGTIFQKQRSGLQQISIEAPSTPGIYFLKLQVGKKIMSRKLVVK